MLQLTQLPFQIFVPQISKISNGKLNKINWNHFKFDNESIVPILNSINNKKSKLNKIKITLYSLSKLDIETSYVFGNSLYLKNIKLIVSNLINPLQIKLSIHPDKNHRLYKPNNNKIRPNPDIEKNK